MPKTERVDVAAALEAIFKAERDLRTLSSQLLHAQHGDLIDQVAKAMAAARTQKSDDERALRMVCLARVLRSVPGPKGVDLLIDVLNDENEEARVAAGMVLEDVATDRVGDVQRGIDRALKRLPAGSIALCELPFVVLGIEDADAMAMLKPLLGHEDPEAVGAAIEALVELADPSAIDLLEPLTKDPRPVRMDDESTGESEQLTVGDLASDAIDALQEVDSIVHPQAQG